jgi:hypothetical protein
MGRQFGEVLVTDVVDEPVVEKRGDVLVKSGRKNFGGFDSNQASGGPLVLGYCRAMGDKLPIAISFI